MTVAALSGAVNYVTQVAAAVIITAVILRLWFFLQQLLIF
jgi:hypothetical protein